MHCFALWLETFSSRCCAKQVVSWKVTFLKLVIFRECFDFNTNSHLGIQLAMIFNICFLKFESLKELTQNKLSCCFLQLDMVTKKAPNRNKARHTTSSKQHIKIIFWSFFRFKSFILPHFEKTFWKGVNQKLSSSPHISYFNCNNHYLHKIFCSGGEKKHGMIHPCFVSFLILHLNQHISNCRIAPLEIERLSKKKSIMKRSYVRTSVVTPSKRCHSSSSCYMSFGRT